MKKIKKVFLVIFISIGMILSFSFFALADEDNSDAARVADMISRLYANEPDITIQKMALDYAFVLTGCREPLVLFEGAPKIVGVYQEDITNTIVPRISLFGENEPFIGILEVRDIVRTVIMIDSSEQLTEEICEKNMEDLEMIYQLVMDIRAATEGMDDTSKLAYIEEQIKLLIPQYIEGCDPVMTKAIHNGYCDCDGYAVLTYLFGINCGLDIQLVSGYTNWSESHAWNAITIDDIEYWHDTTWDITSESSRYFLRLPSSFTSYERRLAMGIEEMETIGIYNS